MRELELLQHVFAGNRLLSERITIPPGDDMGAVRVADCEVLVTVDQVVDGVHVKLAGTELEAVGRKAIVRNLSDVAAMAALPVGAVAAVLLPRDFGRERAEALFNHMRQTAAGYDCPLFGGDIAIHDGPLVLTVTVLAEAAGVPPVRRTGAMAGDTVYATGELGGAWDAHGGGPHLAAEPRIALARALATDSALQLHSMIDVSDGLGGDVRHICEQSGVDAELVADRIPCRRGVDVYRALNDGEDYELCFTAAGTCPVEVEGVKITAVGRVTVRQGGAAAVTLIHPDGRREPLAAESWEHGRT